MPRPRWQSPLHTPLNEMLGTEANVRLLRVLTLADTLLVAGELARRAQLGRTGVYPALAALERTGIIEFVGAGSTRQVKLREAHPLASPIAELFLAETQRVESLVTGLRKMFAKVDKALTSAWLRENYETKHGDPDMMTCYIVADTRSLPGIVDRVEDHLSEIEHTFQVHIEVVSLSRSEVSSRVPAESLDDVLLLAGVPPKALVEPVGPARAIRNLRAHGDHDAGALLLARAIAAKVKRDPGIVRRIREKILARMEKASEQERRELKEWLRIVSTMPPARLQRFLVDGSERAIRLRQSLPALGIVTAVEREMILSAQSEDEVLAAIAKLR